MFVSVRVRVWVIIVAVVVACFLFFSHRVSHRFLFLDKICIQIGTRYSSTSLVDNVLTSTMTAVFNRITADLRDLAT